MSSKAKLSMISGFAAAAHAPWTAVTIVFADESPLQEASGGNHCHRSNERAELRAQHVLSQSKRNGVVSSPTEQAIYCLIPLISTNEIKSKCLGKRPSISI